MRWAVTGPPNLPPGSPATTADPHAESAQHRQKDDELPRHLERRAGTVARGAGWGSGGTPISEQFSCDSVPSPQHTTVLSPPLCTAAGCRVQVPQSPTKYKDGTGSRSLPRPQESRLHAGSTTVPPWGRPGDRTASCGRTRWTQLLKSDPASFRSPRSSRVLQCDHPFSR